VNDIAVPKDIRRIVADLEAATGVAPTVAHEENGAWRIDIDTPRTQARGTFKRNSRGKFTMVDTTLTVDGEPHPIPTDPDEYRALFA